MGGSHVTDERREIIVQGGDGSGFGTGMILGIILIVLLVLVAIWYFGFGGFQGQQTQPGTQVEVNVPNPSG
jgi:hypothetical protein